MAHHRKFGAPLGRVHPESAPARPTADTKLEHHTRHLACGACGATRPEDAFDEGAEARVRVRVIRGYKSIKWTTEAATAADRARLRAAYRRALDRLDA